MKRERDEEGMREYDAVELLETVKLRGPGTGEQVNGGESMWECKQQGEVEEDEQEERGAALAVLLGRMVAYLSGRAAMDELDTVNFGLHHLFCGLDSLYRVLLPSFVASLALEAGEEMDAHSEQLRPLIWLRLQEMRQVVRRMLPLCQLLSEVGECILGQLGYSREGRAGEGGADNREDRAALQQKEYAAGRAEGHEAGEQEESERDTLNVADVERGEQALQNLAASLMCWQQRYYDLPPFRARLYTLFPTIPVPLQPDTPFRRLLEYAITLFGDILPAFHALSTDDDAAVVLLLFDLLQQVDLLAVDCETLLALFHLLFQQRLVAVP
ncbi:MAG TPA: hypothetical protein VKV40_14530 [Ktedonobacteraceae bacterium]|nr:hypothetical protein [Ktedonobacteraceae bacterium]